MTVLDRLREAVSVVCPIDGVGPLGSGAIGPGNTRLDYSAGATAQQQADAQGVLAAFDWGPPAQDAWERNKEPDLRDLLAAANAAIADINTYLAIADTATNVQVRAEVKAIDQRQRRIIQGLKRIIQRVWRS